MSRVDCFSEEKRREVMRAVRREDTAPEQRLRKVLWRRGFRYRKHKRIAGTRPDICFISPKVAVFVDGCFWHGCPEHYVAPVGNGDFWREKLRRNRQRDERNNRALEKAGWAVLRFWECEIRDELRGVVAKIASVLQHRV